MRNLNLCIFLAIILFSFASCKKDEESVQNKEISLMSTDTKIRGIGISSHSYVYHWGRASLNYPGKQYAGYGIYSKLSSARADYEYTLPEDLTGDNVLGVAIASNDYCYYWYSNGYCSYGTSNDAGAYRIPYPYSLAEGKTPDDIVGVAIRKSDDRCFAFYYDGTFSTGTSDNLAAYSQENTYSLPPNKKSYMEIIGMDFDPNGKLYTYYTDSDTTGKSYSVGTASNLSQYNYNNIYDVDLIW